VLFEEFGAPVSRVKGISFSRGGLPNWEFRILAGATFFSNSLNKNSRACLRFTYLASYRMVFWASRGDCGGRRRRIGEWTMDVAVFTGIRGDKALTR